MRVGWSTINTDLQLGESPLSFGYCSVGKKAVNNEFSDYGCAYGLDDIIGIYLDLESTPCKIEYTVNGVSQGVAFEFDKSELGDEALFPHILSKNTAFRINFGQIEDGMLKLVKPKKSKSEDKDKEKDTKEKDEEKEESKNDEDDKKDEEKTNTNDTEEKMETDKVEEEKKDEEKEEVVDELPPLKIIDDYIYINKVDEENLISGPKRPESRSDCEVIMMIGLPGSGKTYWAVNHAKENPEKRYNILGNTTLIERMTVNNHCIKFSEHIFNY